MRGDGPEVSVILVNWNGAALLPRCLGSLARASERASLEVIFVDNGSTDGSGAVARTCSPAAKVIELDRNLGYAAGNNEGLRQARGRYLVLLNTDTELPAETLPAMLEAMRSDPRLGLLGCRQQDATGNEVRSRHEAFGGPLSGEFRAEAAGEAAWVSGACLLARRELYEQIGGLDESFPLYYEDVDWCYRAHRAGWRVGWLGEVSVTHDVGGSSAGIGEASKRQMQLVSQSLFYGRHCHPRVYASWLRQRVARATANAVWSALRAAVCPSRRRRAGLGLRVAELRAYLEVARRGRWRGREAAR